MPTRGVRGAIDVPVDQPQAVLAATRTLLLALLEANPTMTLEDLGSAIFTATADLRSAHPAQAARQMGWTDVPLLCVQEMSVDESPPRLIRVLLHWNTGLPQQAVRHVYLGQAAHLRPDLEAKHSTITLRGRGGGRLPRLMRRVLGGLPSKKPD